MKLWYNKIRNKSRGNQFLRLLEIGAEFIEKVLTIV